MTYSFVYDAPRDLLTVVVEGFWSMEIFKTYDAEFRAQMAHAKVLGGNCRILHDQARFDVQSQPVSEAFSKMICSSFLTEHTGKVAVVTSKTLEKMQAERTIIRAGSTTDPDILRFFITMEDAMSWLFEPTASSPNRS